MSLIDSIDGAIAASGSRSNVLVVQTSEYNGQRLLGVRRWYVDRKTGEWRPTRKGISLSEAGYRFLKSAFQENDDEIRAWLSEDGDHEKYESSSHRFKEDPLPDKPKITVTAGEWNGPEFSKLEVFGPTHKMTLNRRHPIGQTVIDLLESESRDSDETSQATASLIYFLAAFERIPLMFESAHKWYAEELIDAIRWNIGLLLRSFEKFGEIQNEL